MSLIREFIGWQNRPFQGGVKVLNPDGTVQVLAGTYEINLYRHPSETPFATGTVGGGQLTINGAAGTIDFLFASALMTAAPGYGSAEIVDTSVAGGRVLNVIPVNFLPQGRPHQPEYNERLVIHSNSAIIIVEPIDAGGAIVAEGGYVDITVSALGLTWTINNNVVSNAKLADMAAGTIKANITGALADPVDVTRAAFVPWLDMQASEIEVTPSGGIAATTVAAALSELDSEKLGVAANAVSASVWATGRTIQLTGQVTGLSGVFDGSANLSFATALANNTVTDAQLRTSAALTIIGRSANSVGNVADIAAANGSAAVLRESGGVLGFGEVATAGISNNAITDGKLRTSAALTIVGRAANSVGNVADIAAGADGLYLGRRASALGFFAPDASEIVNTPAGTIAATTVQAAINELDTEKLATAGGTISGNLTITGNLTLNGTTYQVNATQVTYDDIILVIGGDTAPVADDAKDRGVEFRWHNGATAKLGFFGFDRSTQEFLFVPDATDTADVVTGTAGTFKGNLNGNAVTASAWATGRTITLTGQVTGLSGAFDGSGNLSFATALAANTVSNAQLRTSGALSIIGRSANSVGDVADIATANGSNAVLRESGGVLGFGTVATSGIADNAITDAKLRDAAALSVIGRSANSVGDPGDIASSADGQFLLRRANVVGFFTPDASEIAFVPGGNLVAVTVEGALDELDSEKAALGLANSFSAGAKQTVSHSATTAGLNIAPVAGDPSAPVDGDVWYNATTAKFRKRENGASSDLASAGGGGGLTDAYVAITDGTNSAASSAGDTLKFRAEDGLRVTVGSNDPTHGDNLLIDITGGQSFLATGEINLPLVATPATPAADTLNLYTRKKGGRMLLGANDPTGLDHLVQPHFAHNKVGRWNPPGNATTIPGVDGFTAPTAQGTATARNVASTNMATRARRLGYVSAATAAAFAGHYSPAAGIQFSIGNGTDLGGFYYSTRFVVSDAATVAGARMFVGLRNASAAPTNVEPSTLTNCVGVAKLSSSSNLHIVYGGSAAQAAIDLGANFPAGTLSADLYELTLYAPPGIQEIRYEVRRLNTAHVATGTLTGTVGTVIPAATTFMGPTVWRTNNATLLAVGIDVVSHYIETDN